MHIEIYTKANCPNCTSAKQLLKAKGLTYEERDIDKEPLWLEFLRKLELRQMPQIFIDHQRVGGAGRSPGSTQANRGRASMIGFIIGLFVGATLGMLTMALCAISRNDD
jgi:glutaredoxin 3